MSHFSQILDSLYRAATLENLMIATFFLCIIYYFLFCRDLPPGPWGIPLLGYWPFLKAEGGHLQLKEFRDKFGEVFSFTATGHLFIFLSSTKAIRNAHLGKSDCFEDRFSDYSLLNLSFDGAVSIVNGESWRVQRKFFTQKFKEYGMITMKKDHAGSIEDSLRETVEELRATEGQPITITDLLAVKCSCIIRRILFNNQGISEEELKNLNQEYGAVLESMTHKNILLMGNIARYLVFPFLPSYWAMLRSHSRIQGMLKDVVRRHKLAFDENHAIDIIDSFYKEKQERERKGDPTAKYFTDQALISSVYQFVTDGVLTVAFFIGLFLEYLVKHPEEQKKIYDELIEVLGPDRQPTIEDKSNLPYTNAFIYEVIRFSDFFILFPSLKCTKETTLNGYRIPKGAITVLNVWSAHHDPDVYDEPFKFDPSRFIAAPGKQRPDLPVMFGIGKRVCMGESFTMIQTFLFLSTIVKNFQLIQAKDTDTSSNLSSVSGMKICAIPRTQDARTDE